jgi:hypothetical protein
VKALTLTGRRFNSVGSGWSSNSRNEKAKSLKIDENIGRAWLKNPEQTISYVQGQVNKTSAFST